MNGFLRSQLFATLLFDTELRSTYRRTLKAKYLVKGLFFLSSLLLIIFSTHASAEIQGIPALQVSTGTNGEKEYSVTLQILGVMTVLSVLPAVLMMVTSFTRIIIVFSILRQAIGLQQAPSNQILVGIALFLTFFIMTPVFTEAYETAARPYLDEEIGAETAIKNVIIPFRKFMISQTRETDLNVFIEISKTEEVNTLEDIPLQVLVPAFITSELKTAFQIGFLLFIPFLIIDLVVASILMAMGMMMLSPLIISLPFKIMLFVMIDGWSLIMTTMANSFVS